MGSPHGFTYYPTIIEDRNGNIIRLIDNQNGAFSFEDTLGRTVLSTSAFATGVTTVAVTGMTNPYNLNWQTVTGHILGSSYNFLTIGSITLPNGQVYHFGYDPVTGFVNQITYPNGATVKYTWGTNTASDMFNSFAEGCYLHGTYNWPAITHREVSFDGVHTALTQDFSYSTVLNHSTSGGCFDSSNIIWLSKSTTVTTHDLVSGTTSQTVYNYLPGDADPSLVIPVTSIWSGTSGAVPLEDTVIYKDGSNNTLRTVKKTWYSARLLNSEQTTLSNRLTSSTIYQRAQYNTSFNPQLTELDQTDFGSGSPGNPLRRTTITYETFGATPAFPGAPSILDLPCQVITYDGAGNRAAETDYFFDGGIALCGAAGSPSVATVSNLPTGTHDETNYGSSSLAARANATGITHKCFIPSTGQSCSDSTVTYAFDETGQIISATDSLRNVTQYSFADSFSDTAPAANTNAYLTKLTLPRTGGVDHIENFTYAYSDGQLTLGKDENGQPTTYLYSDPLRRLTETDFPDTGSTKITYNDSGANPSTASSSAIVGTAILTSTSVMDGLGHVVQTQLNSDPDGIDLVDTVYDGYGRPHTVSNAHRAATAPTDGTTARQFDALGRPTQITKPDGSAVITQYEVSTGVSANRNCTRVTDEAGRQRGTCTDPLGRLVEVDEPGGAGSSGTQATATVTVSGAFNSTWVPAGTPHLAATGTTLASVTMADGSSHNFYFDTNQHLCQLWGTTGSGWSTQDLSDQTNSGPALAGSSLSAVFQSPAIHVFYQGANQHLYDMEWTGSAWQNLDMTVLTGATAASGTKLSTLVGLPNSPMTFYEGTDQHFYLVYWAAWANVWSNAELNTGTGETTLMATNSSVSSGAYGSGLYGFYLGTNQHLITIYWSGSAWLAADLTALSGTTALAVNGSSLTTSVPNVGSTPLMNFYEGAGQHIFSTYWSTGANAWQTLDFTSFTGATNVAAVLTALSNNPSGPQAYYLGSNQHLDDINWNGSAWVNTDLTSLSGSSAVPAAGSALSSHGTSGGNTSNIFFEGTDQHIYHTYYKPSAPAGWLNEDLLTIASNYVIDSGTVSLAIPNGISNFTATVCYGVSTNPFCAGKPVNASPGDIANALAAVLNGAGSPVNAAPSGATLNLTWRTAGYNIATVALMTSTPDNPSLFPAGSFSSTAGTFSGGQDVGSQSLTTPMLTLYAYDALGNLTCVEQHGTATTGTGCSAAPSNDATSPWRVRRFTYDSLSRLLTATNPESGTISYSYDADGNLWQKTSPAPNQTGSATQTISYCYDALNRMTGKAYSPQTCDANGLLPVGTAVASYLYDQTSYNGLAISNGIGRRTGMSDQAGVEAWSYDTMGRPAADKRTIGSVSKGTNYLYNLLGSPTSITYPSGTTIAYTYNTAGRAITATDTTHSIAYTPSATYSPSGSLASMTNATNLSSTFLYNNRLQPCRISVTTGSTRPSNCADTGTIGNILDFEYGFNLAIGDNGNVISITNFRDTARNQSFAYDSLNRLLTAQTNTTTGTKCFGEAFGYDAWGNLLTIGGVSGYNACTQENPGFGGANVQNQISTDAYDTAGNLLTGGYVYDAENRLFSAGGVTYTYDGDGKRVEKSNGKLYWYGMGGDALDESDGSGSTTNAAFSEYIFFSGRRIARRDSTNSVVYYFADHLGTSRVMVQAGQTNDCYDADFYPFGGERTPIVNTCPQTYKFTGKERDESGLDDFDARYYSNSFGRFTSPDPLLNSGRPWDPQSWNRYSYVRNNPLARTDPSGLYDWDTNAGGGYTDDELLEQSTDKKLSKKDRNAAKNALNFRAKFRAALAAATEVATGSDKAALASYGTENDHNHVNVGTQLGAGAGTILDPNDDSITVHFGKEASGNNLAVEVAHEGQHVADGQEWVASGHPLGTMYDLNHYERETRAWGVSARIAEALGMKHYGPPGFGSQYYVWNSSWHNADRVTAAIGKIVHDLYNAPEDAHRYSDESPSRVPKYGPGCDCH
jgi:RHS repeat-associated protein